LRGRDGGEIRLCGFDPATQADEVRQRLGVTLQVTALPDKIEVREALTLFASFYRQSIGVDELLALVVLEEKAASRFDQLSGGQQQQRLAALFTQRQVAVLIRAQLADAELEAEFGRRHIKAALALRVNGEFAGVLARGPRAYGQGYLSEELSVLRALAAQLSRALENQRLHEARRKHAIAEEELRKLVAQSELKALRAQIDPHFFFNALNSVAALIQRAPRAAEELLEDVAELFRHAFKQKPEFVTLAEELELVETYLKVERVRLGAKLQIKMAVLPETRAIKIPALTI
ncbi:MAG: histidine kinase, partial [Acidobacteria bacterium]|nr:histidine kinase [Acidobacteriota bacterium]